jgi:coenzyme F420-0:L-glutamate ligase / coenzyme F420-1:gamma-L-glutamate ligase
VLLTDTSGRPWRVGQTDFALGCAGLRPTEDLRGAVDGDGAPLSVTVRAVADELASAAELVKGKAAGVPAALVRGCGDLVTTDDGPGASGLVRFDEADWFATGTVESVRSALGCPPGHPGVEPAPAVPDAADPTLLARAAAVVRVGLVDDADLIGVSVGPETDAVLVTGPLLAAARVAERVVVAARAERLRTTVESTGTADLDGGTVVLRVAAARGDQAHPDRAHPV